MCGVSGYFSFKSGRPPNREILENILEGLKHRGPDHAGVLFDRNICLGNVRLSIIGVSENGWLKTDNSVLTKGFPKTLKKWETYGWDLHRLEWNISV